MKSMYVNGGVAVIGQTELLAIGANHHNAPMVSKVKLVMDEGKVCIQEGRSIIINVDIDPKEFVIATPENLKKFKSLIRGKDLRDAHVAITTTDFSGAPKAKLTVEELGSIYEQVVGYNLHEDDPSMTADEMTAMMYEYDNEAEAQKCPEGRPFQKKGVY